MCRRVIVAYAVRLSRSRADISVSADPVRRDNSFAEKQESRPARLLLVPSGRLVDLGVDDRIRAEAIASTERASGAAYASAR